MRFKVRKLGAKDRAKHRWHLWFSWYPVRVPSRGRKSGQTMVWFETVERKGDKRKPEFWLGGGGWDWAYRYKQ